MSPHFLATITMFLGKINFSDDVFLYYEKTW